ncbi:unnamed protein product [Closterium sp. NIES-54]
MVQQVLQRFGFTYSSPQSTPLPTGHSLSAPPSDESVEPSGSHRKVHWDTAKRVLCYLCSTSCMGLVLGGRARLVLTGYAYAFWVDDLAMQRSSQGYTFSLGSGSVSWRSTRSSSVLSSSCEAEIYAGAMAAQELRWLTYLLTDLVEAPRSPPVLYVDNKAMLATAKAPLDEVVMDVVGPLKLGAAGAEFFLTIVDVYTRMTWVYVLSKKSDVAETVQTDWLPMVERQQDRLADVTKSVQREEPVVYVGSVRSHLQVIPLFFESRSSRFEVPRVVQVVVE